MTPSKTSKLINKTRKKIFVTSDFEPPFFLVRVHKSGSAEKRYYIYLKLFIAIFHVVKYQIFCKNFELKFLQASGRAERSDSRSQLAPMLRRFT